MTKKEFIEIMERLLSLEKDRENLNKAFQKFEPDFNYIAFPTYETLVADTLKLAMNDTSDWIAWWLWECDYGKKTKNRISNVTDEKGNKIKSETLSDLYDLIKIK